MHRGACFGTEPVRHTPDARQGLPIQAREAPVLSPGTPNLSRTGKPLFGELSDGKLVTGAKPRAGASGGLPSTADKVWQIWNDRLARNAETVAKIIPECDAELGGASIRGKRRGSRGHRRYECRH